MATGRSNQLIKQIGEYLVACELARRGLLVATFSGNVPDFDLIATDFKGSSCPIQVKTIKGGGVAILDRQVRTHYFRWKHATHRGQETSSDYTTGVRVCSCW